MSIVNGLQDFAKKRREHGSIDEAAAAAAADFLNEGFSIVLRLLAPAVPHITQALWEELGFQGLVAKRLGQGRQGSIGDTEGFNCRASQRQAPRTNGSGGYGKRQRN